MVGCGSLQMVSEPIPDPGVGVCLASYEVFVCLAPQSHGTQRGRCVCMRGGEGGVCNVPHRIEEKVHSAIYVETPLNQVDAF